MDIQKLFSLEGKVALVTGAAQGIGFSIAEALASAGAKVAFNSRERAHVEAACKAYAARGVQVRGYMADITNEQQVVGLVQAVERDFGRVDILVNNASIVRRSPLHETPTTTFREVMEADLVAPFTMARAVLPGMVKRGGGKIINICSMMSELGRESLSAFAAAKGGLKMLTKNIAVEYGKYNIQCNGLGPGYVTSAQTASLREKQADGTPNPFESFIVTRTPAARWGTAEDLQGAAVFLASKASDFVNGQVLYVDGGILAYLGKEP